MAVPKVALVCNRDTGGAGMACARLHRGLMAANFSSRLLLRKGEGREQGSIFLPDYQTSQGLLSKIIRGMRQRATMRRWQQDLATFNALRPAGLDSSSMPRSLFDLTRAETLQCADVINLHWVAGVLDWPSFFRRIDKPVVWTLHDENPFSGLQHYEEPFLGMDARGYPILRKVTAQEREFEQAYTRRKIEWLEGYKRLFVVSPSQWLMERSKNSKVLGAFPHFHIPNGLPDDIFRSLDRDQCRECLGLPRSKFLLLFVAEDLTNRRKGFEFLIKALELLPKSIEREVELVSVGSHGGAIPHGNVHVLGPIRDERLMALVYNAADAFVIPSLVDNLPNTMLESMMCGTPVLGFPVGGIRETLMDGLSGLLAEEVSAAALASTIERIVSREVRIERQQLAEISRRAYGMEVQASRYMELFQSVLRV